MRLLPRERLGDLRLARGGIRSRAILASASLHWMVPVTSLSRIVAALAVQPGVAKSQVQRSSARAVRTRDGVLRVSCLGSTPRVARIVVVGVQDYLSFTTRAPITLAELARSRLLGWT